MIMQRTVRNIILGKDYYIQSYAEFKTVLLSGWYALFSILACGLYLFIDLATETYSTSWVFLLSIGVCVFTLLLHRKKRHQEANLLLFPTMAFTIYLFASSESLATGTAFFFLVICLGAFTIFGYDQKRKSYFFTVFVLGLFFLASFFHFSILPYRQYDSLVIFVIFILNFLVALAGLIMVAILMIRLQNYSDRQIGNQNELLKKANTELDRFVYSASHDLRAPLTSVLGLISLAKETDKDHEIRKYLGLMKDRIHSLEGFIHDVTDFSRNSRLAVEKQNVPIAPLILDVWEGLRFIAGADAIRFKMDVEHDLHFVTDPSRIRIVLGNLLSNAIRYHNLTRIDPYVKVSAYKNNHALHLEVEDNGQGIDPQYKARIFDMFFRAHENSKGSGLGLYIVSETLAKVSGSIGVESVLGKGTIFRVSIPVSKDS
jgi:signal transduction histidine kinase